MPVTDPCGNTLSHREHQITKEAVAVIGEVLNDVSRAGERVDTVEVTPLSDTVIAWSILGRSVLGQLLNKAIVAITRGRSQELANHIQAFMTTADILRAQAGAVVRRAWQGHIGTAILSRFVPAAADAMSEAVASSRRTVENVARSVTGRDDLRYSNPLTKWAIQDLDDWRARNPDKPSPRHAQTVEDFISAVEEVTGLSRDKAKSLARQLLTSHMDMFTSGVTHTGRKRDDLGARTDEIAFAVKSAMEAKVGRKGAYGETESADTHERWLYRASLLAAHKLSAPLGWRRTIESGMQGAHRAVVSEVVDFMTTWDRTQHVPQRFRARSLITTPITVLFLNTVGGGVRQLGALATITSRFGMRHTVTGILSNLRRLPALWGNKDSEYNLMLAAVMDQGARVDSLNIATLPVLVAVDRVTRWIAASAATSQFDFHLGRLRQKYAGQQSLPLDDADVQHFLGRGFNPRLIAHMVNSKIHRPLGPFAHYLSRSIDASVGTPNPIAETRVERHTLTQLLLPFSSFLRHFAKVSWRQAKLPGETVRYLQAKANGSTSPDAVARAVAMGFRDRVKGIDWRWVAMTMMWSAGFEHFVLDPALVAVGARQKDDETAVEKTNRILRGMIDRGHVTVDDFATLAGASAQALSEVGAMGVWFDVWKRNVSDDTPRSPVMSVANTFGRAPHFKTGEAIWQHARYAYVWSVNASKAQNDTELILGVARDLGIISEEEYAAGPQNIPGLLSTVKSQLDTLEAAFAEESAVWSAEDKKVMLDYVHRLSMKDMLQSRYGLPLIRNEYTAALFIDHPHFNNLLEEFLLRARTNELVTRAGSTIRIPDPDTPDVPPLTAGYESGSAFVAVAEAVLAARYGYADERELWQKRLAKRIDRDRGAARVFRNTQGVTDVLPGGVRQDK